MKIKKLLTNGRLRALSKVVAVVTATLLVVFIAVLQAGIMFAPNVNEFLNAQTYIKIKGDATNENTNYFPADYDSADEVSDYADRAAIEIEREGLVMLRNDGALPLGTGKRSVTLFGQGAVSLNYSTSGSSATDTTQYKNFKEVLEESGFAVNPTLWDRMASAEFKPYIRTFNKVNGAPWSFYAQSQASFGEYGDAAIVVFARSSGEGSDVPVSGSDGEDGSYLSVTARERELLSALTDLKEDGVFDSIVLLINSAVMLQLDFLTDDKDIDVDAALWIGNLGRVGAYGVADVLSGEVNPSGRLSDTYLNNNFSSPAMATWNRASEGFAEYYTAANGIDISSLASSEAETYAVYAEGVYVGYRYHETRYEDYVMGSEGVGDYNYAADVAYPFGHGLSYTTFDYSGFAVAPAEGGYNVSVTVTNTGEVPGKEVVQIYAQKAYDAADGVEKPSVELVGFDKTKLLESGEPETISIFISDEQFKSYDSEGHKTYILSKGDYYLAAGKNAHDALNNILAAKGYTPDNTKGRMDAAGDADMAKVAFTQNATDAETFSRSYETGNAITNRLDFMDINRYEHAGDNSVTYLSRSDWTGTFPKGRVQLVIDNNDMLYDLSVNKLVDNGDATAPKYGASNGLTLAMLRNGEDRIESGDTIAYNNPIWNDLLDQMTFEEQATLVTRCAYQTPAIDSVGKPPTADQDSPTAFVKSITGASFPSEGIWASSFNVELIAQVGDALAEDVRIAGYHTLYAPGINIHRTPFGGRTHEYFSEDPYLTAMSCIAEVQALQAKGVICTLKHYAFNNEETHRAGISIWMNEQEAREIMLLPFEYAMRPSMGNAHAIMTSFNRAGCIWTSASPELMIDISRTEWDFDGYSITDMANSDGGRYMIYSDGIYNGTDCFLSSDGDSLNAFRSAPAFQQRMREACHRILYTIANYSCAMNGWSSTDRIVTIMPWWQVLLVVFISVFAVLACISALWWIAGEIVAKLSAKKQSGGADGNGS